MEMKRAGELIRRMEKECDTIGVKNGSPYVCREFSKTDRIYIFFSGKQISAADQIRIDKYMSVRPGIAPRSKIPYKEDDKYEISDSGRYSSGWQSVSLK